MARTKYTRDTPMKSKKILYFASCIIIIIIGIAIYYWEELTAPKIIPQPTKQTLSLDAIKITLKTHTPELVLVGTLHSQRDNKYISKATGVITEILVHSGEKVAKGQLLASVENDNQKHILMLNKSLESSASTQLKRKQALFKHGIISKSALEQVTNEVTRLKMQLHQSQMNYDNTLIKAKTTGIITSIHITLHQFVTPGTPLLEVSTPGDSEYVTYIPEKYLINFQNLIGKNSCAIANYHGKQIPLTLTSINASVDPRHAGFKADFKVNSAMAPPKGTTARIIAELSSVENSALTPINAVYTENNNEFIYSLNATNQLIRLQVNSHGIRFDNKKRFSIITSPKLHDGMLIIVSYVEINNLNQTIHPKIIKNPTSRVSGYTENK
jgi:RND family efflux transporter MFP subunit